MRRLSLAAGIALLFAIPVAAVDASTAEGPADAAPPRRLALLVGICTYETPLPDFSPLHGPPNDVAAMREILTSRYGFAAADVLVLEDAAATHEAIVRAFHDFLIGRAGPDTEALFYFAGHGSRVPDASERSRETEDMDSALVAYDSRAVDRAGGFDVCDDELDALIAALLAKTRHVTVITDCCHAGDMLRGGKTERATVRGARTDGTSPLRRDLVLPFWPEDILLREDDDPARPSVSAAVHLAACDQRELAYEFEERGASGAVRHFGFFTYCLAAVLRDELSPRATWRDVFRAAHVRMMAYAFEEGIPQTPRCEGDVTRVVFGGGDRERAAGYAASLVEGGVMVEAGAVVGIGRGSVLRVHGADGAFVGRVRVNRASGVDAFAFWAEGPAEKAVAPFHAMLEGLPHEVEPLRVRVDHPRLREAFGASPLVRMTGAAGEAGEPEYVVTLDGDDPATLRLVALEGVALHGLRGRGGLVEGIAPTATVAAPPLPPPAPLGEPRGAGPDAAVANADAAWDDAIERLRAAFQAEAHVRRLLLHVRAPGRLVVGARFVEPLPEELHGGRGYSWDLPAAAMAEAGSSASLDLTLPATGAALGVIEVENANAEDVFVCILSLLPDHRLEAIWPPDRGLRENTIRAGSSERYYVEFRADPDWPADRPMPDRYLVIATDRFVDVGDLTESARYRGPQRSVTGDAFGTAYLEVAVRR